MVRGRIVVRIWKERISCERALDMSMDLPLEELCNPRWSRRDGAREISSLTTLSFLPLSFCQGSVS